MWGKFARKQAASVTVTLWLSPCPEKAGGPGWVVPSWQGEDVRQGQTEEELGMAGWHLTSGMLISRVLACHTPQFPCPAPAEEGLGECHWTQEQGVVSETRGI